MMQVMYISHVLGLCVAFQPVLACHPQFVYDACVADDIYAGREAPLRPAAFTYVLLLGMLAF
jgi:hypothetical protein